MGGAGGAGGVGGRGAGLRGGFAGALATVHALPEPELEGGSGVCVFVPPSIDGGLPVAARLNRGISISGGGPIGACVNGSSAAATSAGVW